MASHGDRYTIDWVTPTADCRLRIQQEGYSSSVTQLTPAVKPFAVTWAQRNREDLTLPLKVSTARIRFIGDSGGEAAVQDIFDSGDTEYRVLFERDLGGWQLEWQGYMATDLWRDDPHLDSDTVELEAIDGLALLEDNDFNYSGGDLYSAARSILRGLHELDVAANMEWYPYREGNQLDANQLPLGVLSADEQAFDELEPKEDEKGFETTAKRSERRALEAILERFGMELFQSRGEWQIRQRHRIQSDGTIKTWPDSSAATNDNPTTRDLNRTLGALEPRQRPRSGVERLRTAKSVHTYDELGELVRQGSFEPDLSGWTTQTPGQSKVLVKEYDNTPLSRSNRQGDTKVAKLRPDYDSGSVNEPKLTQEVPAINHFAGPTAAYQIQWDMAVETKSAVPTALIRAKSKSDTYYAKPIQLTVQKEAAATSDGDIVVEALPGSDNNLVLPKGSELFVLGSGFPFTRVTLTENAYAGDRVLQAQISEKVKTDNDQKVVAWVWSPNVHRLQGIEDMPQYPTSAEVLVPQKVLLPQVTPTGEEVTDDLTIRFSAQVPSDNAELEWYLDHVSAQLLVDGRPIEQTSYTALDDQSGRNISITQLIGDGPTYNHPRALKLPGTEVTKDWQEDAYSSGDSPSGQLIEEITAEAAMREQRDTLQRLTHDVQLRDEEVWPQDVFTIDSELYTVSYLTRIFGTDGDIAEAELTRLKDSGTSGLERTFKMESSESSAGAGGGSSGSGGGAQNLSVSAINSTFTGEDASSSDKTKDSPTFELTGTYYDGSGSVERPFGITHEIVNDDPTSKAVFSIDGTEVFHVDDVGNIVAQGDVTAFGSSSGSGGGGTSFQPGRSLSFDTGTDPQTLDVDLAAGSNISLTENGSGNYEISASVPSNVVQEGDDLSLLNNDSGFVDAAGARSAVEGTSDVADLSGGLGTSGQVPQSDGTGVSWTTLGAADISGVSPDSDTDAHHTRPSAGDGLSESTNTWSVNESQVDHDSLSGYVSDEHVGHSNVSISAGTALSGGGDLTSTRTLNVSGPLTGITFKNSGDNLEWQTDGNNDLVLQNTTDNKELIRINQDTGDLIAQGDVTAFGSSSGSGGGGTTFEAGYYLTLSDRDSDGTDELDVDPSTMGWMDLDISQSDVSKSDVGLGSVPNTDIAYASTIAADAFTSTEVSNLRGNALADGSTPWTSNNKYTDSDAVSAINSDSDHGSTASHNYYSDADLPSTLAYEDEANTFTSTQEITANASLRAGGNASSYDSEINSQYYQPVYNEDRAYRDKLVATDDFPCITSQVRRSSGGAAGAMIQGFLTDTTNSDTQRAAWVGLLGNADPLEIDHFAINTDSGDSSPWSDPSFLIKSHGGHLAASERGRVVANEGFEVAGFKFDESSSGHLEITTPSGNTILLKDDGDVEAFA